MSLVISDSAKFLLATPYEKYCSISAQYNKDAPYTTKEEKSHKKNNLP
jgi:hypothetical protein